jgi:glycine/D-amino acid oxidase-like deaminating enzyme
VARSVREIEATVAAEGIDAELDAGGLLRVATNDAQLRRIEADRQTADRLGLDGFRLLDAAGTRALLDSPSYLGGLVEDACVIVQPAKLAVGLAEVLRRRGVRLHERTPVVDLEEVPGGVVATTPHGQVRADNGVLATNAWAHRFPPVTGWVAPLSTYIVATEPLTDAQWDGDRLAGPTGRGGRPELRALLPTDA